MNVLDDEINNILEKLDISSTTLELRYIFCKKPHNFEKERELGLSAEEKINKIEGLKEEVENKEDKLLDHLLDSDIKFSKLSTDLEYEKIEALHNITVLQSKLEKLKISPERIDKIKDLIFLS